MTTFQTMTDERHAPALVAMMEALYSGDAINPGEATHGARNATDFHNTIRHLLAAPQQGHIVLFLEAGTLLGYAILIPYWSNEFGGNLVFIDEIFVHPLARGRAIAKTFFRSLHSTRPFEAVALALEVSPNNVKARQLYESVGFVPRTYSTLVCPIAT
jgi:GNAT superfamily N-acetyltransferase